MLPPEAPGESASLSLLAGGPGSSLAGGWDIPTSASAFTQPYLCVCVFLSISPRSLIAFLLQGHLPLDLRPMQ